jgi:hypothetical protein
VLYSDNKIAGTRAGLDPLIYPNVNWYDELFRSGAMNQNINVTIRGGSKKLDYFSSVSVNHDSGVLRNTDDFSYKNNLNIMRYVFQNNFNLNLSKSSKLSLNLNVQLRDYSGPTSNTSDLFGMVMESNPVDFPVRFPDDPNVDYIRWGGKSGGKYNSGFRNPYAEMARGYQSQFESTVMANLKFEQKLDFITEGLSAEALFSFKNWSSTNTNRSAGYNQFQVINYNTDNLSDYTLNRIGSEQSTVLQTSNKSSGDRRLYIQAMINYNRTFNTEKLSITSGSIAFKSPLEACTPSMIINGLLVPLKVEIPRIQKSAPSAPGSPERCTATTPAKRPAKPVDNWELGTFSSSGFTICTEPTTDSFFCVP